MVQKGKPEPDIFLLAAQKMNSPIENCVIIEDSLDGIRAGKKAGVRVFAFVGAKANNNDKYKQECLNIGADKVFDNMADLHKTLININL